MIAVVDSGVANLASVMAALARLHVTCEITSEPARIQRAERVILPGVGSADAAMRQLRSKELTNVLRTLTQPVLGICLGMQLLYSRSEEGGGIDCLGVMPGTVKQLEAGPERPVPHMGWNQIQIKPPQHPLLRGIGDGSFVYFVHSYAAPAGKHTLASCDYGIAFAAVVSRANYYGCQFHPERSGTAGSLLLKNFLEL